MFIKSSLLFSLIFCLGFSNAYGLEVGKISYQYEASLDSQYVIGAMPRVDLQDAPGTKICGRWYRGDQPANAPNVAQAQSMYCRTTGEDGKTFFVYRDRFSTQYPVSTWNPNLVDLSQRGIRFRIISPVNQYIPVGY